MPARKPSAVLEANGAFDKDPQRRRVDPVAHGELGNAPRHLSEAQREIWKEIKEQMPEGLAKAADRFMVEIVCRLMDKSRTTGINGSELGQLINALGRLGMSPADRSKCALPPAPSKNNEFAEF